MSDKTRGLLVQAGRGVVGRFDLPRGTRIETPQRPSVPPDSVPLHMTPLASGLAVDSSIGIYALKRVSPFRNRWPEVLAFDERVEQLEQKQANVNAELAVSQEQLVRAQAADTEAMVLWVADNVGERPLPTGPGIEQRIADLTSERDALMLAVRHVLDEKSDYVEKHRGRLAGAAAQARARAVERLHKTIQAVEGARAEAAACVVAERWAREFPDQQADAGSLGLQMIRGGRLSKAIPEITSRIVPGQVLELLRDDAQWLDTVLADKQRTQEEVDPHLEAVWEQSPEGRKAVELANSRIAAGLKPKHTREAGWGD